MLQNYFIVFKMKIFLNKNKSKLIEHSLCTSKFSLIQFSKHVLIVLYGKMVNWFGEYSYRIELIDVYNLVHFLAL